MAGVHLDFNVIKTVWIWRRSDLMPSKWNGEQMEADETRETPMEPVLISRLRQSADRAASHKSNQKSITGRVTVSHAQNEIEAFGPEKTNKQKNTFL